MAQLSLCILPTDLEGDEDDEVGQVEGEDLAAGGGPGDDLEGCLQQGSAFCSCQSQERKIFQTFYWIKSSNEISNQWPEAMEVSS